MSLHKFQAEIQKRTYSRSKISLEDIDKQTVQSKGMINLGTNPFMDTIQTPSCTSIQDYQTNYDETSMYKQIESRQIISPSNIKQQQSNQFLKPPVNSSKSSSVQKPPAPFQKKNLKNLLSKLGRKESDDDNDFAMQDSITDENPNIEFKVLELNNNQTSNFTKFDSFKKKTEKSQKDINYEQINNILEAKKVTYTEQEAINTQNIQYSPYLQINDNKMNGPHTFNNYQDGSVQQYTIPLYPDNQSINPLYNQANTYNQQNNLTLVENLALQPSSSYQQNQIQNFNNFNQVIQTKSLDNGTFQQIYQSPQNQINPNSQQNPNNVQPFQSVSISQMLRDSNLLSSTHQQQYLACSPNSTQINIKSLQDDKEKQTINNTNNNQILNSMQFNQISFQDAPQNGFSIEGGGLSQYPINSFQVLQSPQKQSQNNLSFSPNYQLQMSQQQQYPDMQNQEILHQNYLQKRSQSYGNLGQPSKELQNLITKLNDEIYINEKQNFVKNPPFIIGQQHINQSEQQTNSANIQQFEKTIQLNTQYNRSPQNIMGNKVAIDQNSSSYLQDVPFQIGVGLEQNLSQFKGKCLPLTNQQMTRSSSTHINRQYNNDKGNCDISLYNKGKINPTTNTSFSSANQSFCNNNSVNIANQIFQHGTNHSKINQNNQKPVQREKENPITRLRNKSLSSSQQQQRVQQQNKQNIQVETQPSKDKMNFNCMMRQLICNSNGQQNQENRQETPQYIKNETSQISKYLQKGDMSPLSSQATPINAPKTNSISIAQVIQVKDGNIINPMATEAKNLSINQNGQFSQTPFRSPQKNQFQQIQNYSISTNKSPSNFYSSQQPRIVNVYGKGDIHKDRLSPYSKEIQKEKYSRSQSCQKTQQNKIDHQGIDKSINKTMNVNQKQTPTQSKQKTNIAFNGNLSDQKGIQLIQLNNIKQIQNPINQYKDENNRIYSTNFNEKQFQPTLPESPLKSVEQYTPFDINRNSIQSFQYDLSSIKNRVSSFHVIPQQQTNQMQVQNQQDDNQVNFPQPNNNQELIYQQLTSSQLKQSNTHCFQNNCLGSYCFTQCNKKSQNSQNSQVLNTSNVQNDQSLNTKKITSQQLDKSGRQPLQQNNMNMTKKEVPKNAIQIMRIHQKSSSITGYGGKYGHYK